MAKRQQKAVEKRALQQRRRAEAERLAKQQADLEEQRRKLLEEELELSDEDQDLNQDLEDPSLVFGQMQFDSEVPSLPNTFTLGDPPSPQREVESKSHRGDNLHLTPKVGVTDPALGTPISVFQGATEVDPSTAKIREVLQSPLVQSVGAASQAQETKAKKKKKFDALAIPSSHAELEDDVTSPQPQPLQVRDPEPQRVDPTVPKVETVSKRKRGASKKSAEDDSTEKEVAPKRRRGKTQPKLPWIGSPTGNTKAPSSHVDLPMAAWVEFFLFFS